MATKNIKPSRLLSILMPVYNEYAFVRSSITAILKAKLPEDVNREIVVVDDGSTDGTTEILTELQARHPEIRLIQHSQNQGKGAAIRTAIANMQGDIAIFQDADLEYDPNDYVRVIAPIIEGRADVVYGSRFAYSEERRVLFYHHMLGNLFLTHLSNMFTGLNLTDMESCYKAFRVSLLKSIPIRSNGFGIEPEITAKIAKRDCIVYEVPITYRGRSYDEGKKITWKDGIVAFFTILKYWLIDDCYDERYGHAVLVAMSKTRRFSRWIADLTQQYLGRHVLELGSGIGNMSRHLCGARKFVASDIDPVYLDLLGNQFAGRSNVEIVKLDVTSAEDFAAIHGQGIDTIVSFNMMEHIEDDAALLKEAHQLLPIDGKLILQVPQYPSLFSSYDEQLNHKRRYGKLDLRGLLVKAGFEIEVMRSVNWLGLPGWYLNSRLLKRQSFGKFQLKLFDLLVPLLRLTEFIPLPGLSIFVVARKR